MAKCIRCAGETDHGAGANPFRQECEKQRKKACFMPIFVRNKRVKERF
jgi:hypothetical protein